MTTARWDEDEKLACPGCWAEVEDVWLLCGHDDGPGAVCPLCCEFHHPDEVAA